MTFFRYIQAFYSRSVTAFYKGPSWLWRRHSSSAGRYISPSFMLLIWCHGWINRIFTFQGWMLFWVCLATAFYATVMVRSAVMILFLVLAGLFLVNGLFLLLLFPRLKVTRKVPARVMQGRVFTVEYEIENLSPFPCYCVLADPLLQSCGILETDTPEFFSVPGRGKHKCVRKFLLKKRGIWELPSASAETAFPFGLLKASFCNHKCSQILVHPRYRKWEQKILYGSGNENGNSSLRKGNRTFQRGLDLAACREYVYGDEVRYIHWGNSAKWGRLVVKEFEEEKNFRMSVILDTGEKYTFRDFLSDVKKILHLQSFSFGSSGERLEGILSFASSLASCTAGEEGVLVDFYIMENREKKKELSGKWYERFYRKWILGKGDGKKECIFHEVTVGERNTSFTAFLDLVSGIKNTRYMKERFSAFSQEMLQKISERSFVLLVLSELDADAENFYLKIVKKGITCKVLYVAKENGGEEKNIPVWAEKISKEMLLSGVWRKMGVKNE